MSAGLRAGELDGTARWFGEAGTLLMFSSAEKSRRTRRTGEASARAGPSAFLEVFDDQRGGLAKLCLRVLR